MVSVSCSRQTNDAWRLLAVHVRLPTATLDKYRARCNTRYDSYPLHSRLAPDISLIKTPGGSPGEASCRRLGASCLAEA
eukprot:1185163-Prorocentrum_minimum.AAC.2